MTVYINSDFPGSTTSEQESDAMMLLLQSLPLQNVIRLYTQEAAREELLISGATISEVED